MIELTELIGMSERTVKRIFKKHFDLTPYNYIKYHRLNLVRNTLLQCDNEKPHITEIGMHFGFMYMGYFGKEYKKLFCETPSETFLKRVC